MRPIPTQRYGVRMKGVHLQPTFDSKRILEKSQHQKHADTLDEVSDDFVIKNVRLSDKN